MKIFFSFVGSIGARLDAGWDFIQSWNHVLYSNNQRIEEKSKLETVLARPISEVDM